MKKILFDTDVLIEHLRGNGTVDSHMAELNASSAHLAYSPVTEAEIYRGLRSNERAKTELILNQLECLEITRTIGKWAGEYLRKYARSHGLETGDALIAATAQVHRFALCTFNWRHYPMHDIERHHIDR
ncbi:MAG: type II toxin-antitoxin system VapC family toxin [Deltaproteobacteria bacterium]|nr:type II toxin-antitoxin system VapC family toxin [Deltaproteobacteria bacterium]